MILTGSFIRFENFYNYNPINIKSKKDSKLYEFYNQITCICMYKHNEKVWGQVHTKVLKEVFFQWEDQWLLFSSLLWEEEGLISKSLKLINYFNFFPHHTGNLWMHFHCKIPNSTLPLSTEKKLTL